MERNREIGPLLQIGRGITALIGSGGKTTLLYTLAEELRRQGSVILCTSTKIRVPDRYPVLTEGDETTIRLALRQHGVVCVGTPYPPEKLSAPQLPFPVLADLADYVLVEADGAHMLPLKAHADYEPVIPAGTVQTVLVVGMDGLGKPVGEVCHRPARYAQLAAVTTDTPVTPAMAARVIRAENLADRVYLNKVETDDMLDAARALARELTCPVIAGSLHKGVYTCLR